jgi:hypothetical protein
MIGLVFLAPGKKIFLLGKGNYGSEGLLFPISFQWGKTHTTSASSGEHQPGGHRDDQQGPKDRQDVRHREARRGKVGALPIGHPDWKRSVSVEDTPHASSSQASGLNITTSERSLVDISASQVPLAGGKRNMSNSPSLENIPAKKKFANTTSYSEVNQVQRLAHNV